MKKLFALALVVLGLAACQTDHSDLDVQFDGNATVTLSIPADAVTRAGGSDSALSGLDNTTGETLRFIMEIYDENGVKSAQRYVDYADEGTLSVTFPVQLVPGRSYTLVAWADMVDAEADVDKYYDTSDLKNITLKDGTWNAMDEARDAFTDNCFIDNYSGTSTIELNLVRPFAKVRVVATDLPQVKNLHLDPTTATVTYNKPIPVSYNAFEQKVGTDTESKVHTKFALVGANGEKLYGDNSETQMVLYADYIFANNEQGAVSFTIKTFDQNDVPIKETTFNTDIAVKRNMLTTIKGDIMTTSKNITVEIENGGEFGSTHDISAISSAAALLNAIRDGGNVMLTQNITITAADLLSAGILSTRSSAIETFLNLNGYGVIFEDNVAVPIPENTTLTIQDNSENGNGSIMVENTTTDDNINGGFVNNGTINLEGGNLAEGVINNTDNGNVTITNDNIDNNVVTGNTSKVTNYAKGLEEAFTNGGEYTLGADVTLNKSLKLDAGKALTLDLNGKTIFGKTSGNTNPQDMMLIKGNLTVENGTIIAEHVGDNMGWAGQATIFNITAGGVVNLDGVTAKHLGGSDMNFVAHLNNWGTATFNAVDSTLEATYIAVRVFNSGPDMNNVTIENSTLKGKFCFWVHNYNPAGDNCGYGGGTDATLTIDILNGTNTFEYTGKAPILYGFNEPLYFDAEGNLLAFNIEDLKKFIGEDNQRSEVALANDIELNEQLNIAKEFTLDLNGKTITGKSTGNNGNKEMFLVKGNLTVENGTITAEHTGENMGWNAMTTIFDVTAGGVLNLEGVTAKNLGGSDMGFVAHLNNWGEVTLNVDNCTLESNYVAVRVFNSGPDMNNVTIKNSTLKGGNYAFWVHNYTVADFGSEDAAESQKALLNFDIFNGTNTFVGKNDTPIRYGMTNAIYLNAKGQSPEEIAFAETLAKGGTVTLSNDITLNAAIELENTEVILDLNGKTITSIAKNGYVFENKGNLTIKGNGTINGVVYTEGSGNTIIENGTYNALENGKYVFLNSEGTLTINGGTINGGSSYPIYSYNANNELVINDVTVNATFGCVNAYGTGGKVTINGGTYQMTGVQGKTSHIAYLSNVDATINGGTFQKIGDISMSGTGGGGICAIYGANLTINGGTFAGDYADVYNWSGTNANGRAVAISIKGGSYKFEPNKAFVAEGKTATQNADGSWEVK